MAQSTALLSSPPSAAARRHVESAEARARVFKLGLAAVLTYGLFDAVTYTAFFVLAFLGYERSTDKNPAANLKALLGVGGQQKLIGNYPVLFPSGTPGCAAVEKLMPCAVNLDSRKRSMQLNRRHLGVNA
ncbi:uncharacterized protein LOC133924895 [Phragmites australis]|uniref:uncharacterized protein LOC133924895 n=1 Tax=Phragmites australis TaxID=29695 RepID=UPI002D787ADD|nr:uncharacterized protein LOC133924895 [Phragmites australis]